MKKVEEEELNEKEEEKEICKSVQRKIILDNFCLRILENVK